MAAASSLLSEDQFLCSICLDVFTDPVTTSCGHNFCMSCITAHWDRNVQWQCPMCKEQFDRRPKLRVNTFISEMSTQFRRSVHKKTSSSSEQKISNAEEVFCDVCTETRVKALKSCLVCLTSYCETHLEPHHRITGLKRHKLINPVENLEDRMCKNHNRPLEVFCRTDQKCVCQFCTESDHKLHDIVPLEEEYEGKKAELGKTEAEVQQKIQEGQLKIQQIKDSVKLSKEDADREAADCEQVFRALIRSVEKHLAQLTEMIEEKQKTTEKQAEGFIQELEEEISELMKRSSKLEKFSQVEDHLHLLQSFPFLNSAPPTKDWTEVRVHASYMGTVRTAVAQLEETLSEEMKKLCADVELKRLKQYAVDVTLDPETADPHLILSDDRKQVTYCDIKQNLPENPKRFSALYVLGKQSFHSGRFYYEVQVKEKTDWTLGVAREPINGGNFQSHLKGKWSVLLRDGNEYYAFREACIRLSLKSPPQKVGVFVDYEEGLVFFYDVDDAALIFSFKGCTFNGKLLHPYFNPCDNNAGKNSAPLIICSPDHAD